MPAEPAAAPALVQWGSLALRLAAMLVYLPLPGWKTLPAAARVLFALALAAVLWIAAPPEALLPVEAGPMLPVLGADLLTGVAIGLIVLLVSEAFSFCGQVISVQAGFSYASTIDPFSETDSGLLPSLFSLATSLLLFYSPLYAELVRALAASAYRPPHPAVGRAPEFLRILTGFSAHCLQVGLKLALPVIALLFLSDLCIGLFGRLQPQLQLLTVSFSLKLMAAMAAVAALLPALRWLHQKLAVEAVHVLRLVIR